ncbi:DNA methylase [Sphingobium faniae]|nr:DNA methylase [Sphingobium faniae]
MSRLTELLAQAKAKDTALGNELEREFRALSARRAFGLNFERHKPESVELPGRPIRKGDKVRILPKRGSTAKGDQRLWKVRGFEGQGEGRQARLELLGNDQPEQQSASLADLIVVAEFKDYIYPGLFSTGKVERGGDKPFHTVINGENFHVLEALTFTHRGKIDAIYIDPPYNSGARDWKYNNDYVEKDDLYRHSKWLAMIERRLLVARKLLNPNKSALIITIDEKEYLRLGLLLEQVFPEAGIQMVTSVINPFGVSRQNELSRVEEYVFYVRLGNLSLGRPNSVRNLLARENDEEMAELDEGHDETHWFSFMRAGSNSTRTHSPGCHYPIFVDGQGTFHSVGEALEQGQARDDIPCPQGTQALWPIKTNKTDGVWQASPDHARFLFANGFARIGKFRKQIGRRSVTYLREGTISRLASGELRRVDI